eukprot:jgi/Psemu1/15798/gm1.15798_g
MEAALNTATQNFYHPELEQSMLSPKPIQTPGEDEDERVTRVSQLDVFQHLPDSSLGTNDNNNNNNNNKDDDVRGGMVTRSNKLNKGHLCLKWHSATKARSAQELVKQIDPGYEEIEKADLLNTLDWLVAPVHHCLGYYNTKSKFRPWIHHAYNMSKEGEFTAQHTLPPKYKGDNHFNQDWCMGIYMQLVTNHCPEWVDDVPTCATNFASMAFPIFARDTEDMEASAAGPDTLISNLLNHGKAQVPPSTAKSLGIAKAMNIRALQETTPLRAWRRSYFNNQMQK